MIESDIRALLLQRSTAVHGRAGRSRARGRVADILGLQAFRSTPVRGLDVMVWAAPPPVLAHRIPGVAVVQGWSSASSIQVKSIGNSARRVSLISCGPASVA